MRVIVSALLVMVMMIASVGAQSPKAIEQAHKSVVKIEVPDPTDPETVYFCTGVVISIVRVLTAEHCIPANYQTIIVNDTLPARVIKKSADLILLEVPPQSIIMSLAAQEPKVGDATVSIGWVDRVGTRVSLRRWVAGYGRGEAKMVMGLDGTLVRGMSGGPVINEQGQLVGINQAVNQGIGLVTRLSTIKDFLK